MMQALWPELVERHGGGSERNTGGESAKGAWCTAVSEQVRTVDYTQNSGGEPRREEKRHAARIV